MSVSVLYRPPPAPPAIRLLPSKPPSRPAAVASSLGHFQNYDFGCSSPIAASYQCTNANRNNIPAPSSIAVIAAA